MYQIAAAVGTQILTALMVYLSTKYHLTAEQQSLLTTDILAGVSMIGGGFATWHAAYKFTPPQGAGK